MTTTKANEALRERTKQWAVQIGVEPQLIRVQEMKRKWGSCSTKGVVTLAADLSNQPAQFRDFVIVHELLHLKVPNHGKLFKALLAARIPNWRSLELTR